MTTPYVEYSYADGTANTLRPTGLKYPNGRELTYDYDAADSPADLLSRVFQIKDGADALAQYDYLGIGAIITAEYPEPEVAYDLTYDGTVDDPLAGCLDSLGRITQVPWVKDDAVIAGATYQYDRVANRTQMQPLGYTATADRQRYQYDPLYRLTNLARGETDEAQGAERWSLDATGNWREYDVLDAADAAKNLSQRRTANRVNELTAINNFYGANWAPPQYDPAGNMTQLPQPNSPSDSYTATYDAWNRLVKLQDGETTVEEYAYDAKTRRVTQAAGAGVRHAYFSLGWQNLEERVDASTTAERQFVWGLRYIDDLVLRDTAERYYDLQDGNWNTVAVIDDAGDVQQRFRYAAYGEPTRLNPDGSVATGIDTILWETLYAGYRYDGVTGLNLARYRYLGSILGQWLSKDPLGASSGSNLYEYCTSTPLRSLDASGLIPSDCNFSLDVRRVFPTARIALPQVMSSERFNPDKVSERARVAASEIRRAFMAAIGGDFGRLTAVDLGEWTSDSLQKAEGFSGVAIGIIKGARKLQTGGKCCCYFGDSRFYAMPWFAVVHESPQTIFLNPNNVNPIFSFGSTSEHEQAHTDGLRLNERLSGKPGRIMDTLSLVDFPGYITGAINLFSDYIHCLKHHRSECSEQHNCDTLWSKCVDIGFLKIDRQLRVYPFGAFHGMDEEWNVLQRKVTAKSPWKKP